MKEQKKDKKSSSPNDIIIYILFHVKGTAMAKASSTHATIIVHSKFFIRPRPELDAEELYCFMGTPSPVELGNPQAPGFW